MRIILIGLMVAVCLFMPIFMTVEIVSFYKEVKLVDAIDWRRADAIIYPNITICDSMFFSKTKMDALNISNHMANYLAMGLNPNSGNLFRWYSSETFVPNYTLIMKGLELELDQILLKHNVGMNQLVKMIAVE